MCLFLLVCEIEAEGFGVQTDVGDAQEVLALLHVVHGEHAFQVRVSTGHDGRVLNGAYAHVGTSHQFALFFFDYGSCDCKFRLSPALSCHH